MNGDRTPSFGLRRTFVASIAAAALALCVWSIDVAVFAQAKPSAPPKTPPAQPFPSDPVWSKEISAKPVAVAPLVASADRVFLALESGISARRMTDGSEIWKNEIIADGPMAVSPDHLVVQSKGVVHVLSTEHGKEEWTDQTGTLSAPPLVYGDHLFLAAAEQLMAYQLADGTKRWTQPIGTVEQRPALEGLHMYVPVADGRLVAMTVADGKELWQSDVGISPSEPLVHADHIYIGSAAKFFYSLKMQDGREEWKLDVGAPVFGRAAADATRVYFVALDNLVRAHNLRRGQRDWKHALSYRPSAGPLIVGTSVSTPGLSSELEGVDTKSGKVVAKLTLGEKLAAVPVFITSVKDGRIYIAAITGSLNNQWTLTLAGPPPMTPPTVPVTPLTVLPGVVVRPGPPLALPGVQPRSGGHPH